MGRFIQTLAAVAALLVLPAAPVSAITNGVLDTEHTNVGMLGVEYAPGLAFFFCSGTLIAPNVFVTAAHCVAAVGFWDPQSIPRVVITFDADIFEGSGRLVPATAGYVEPGFGGHNVADTHDLGVVILSEQVTEWNGEAVDPADLPTSGQLDQMAAHGGLLGTSFVNVGYGADALLRGRPGIEWGAAGIRRVSTSPFLNLSPSYLKLLQNNNATGEGGVCYDDSGGPKFIPGTNTIVATNFANTDPYCRTVSLSYRLDTPEARAFLGQFVTLP
jgi:hypothetical protein